MFVAGGGQRLTARVRLAETQEVMVLARTVAKASQKTGGAAGGCRAGIRETLMDSVKPRVKLPRSAAVGAPFKIKTPISHPMERATARTNRATRSRATSSTASPAPSMTPR